MALSQFVLLAIFSASAEAFVDHVSVASGFRPSIRPVSQRHASRHASAAPVQMGIAVLGGAGLTGSETVYQALKRGEKVYTLVRDPSKMAIPAGSGGAEAGKSLTNDNLTVLKGDVTNKADVDKLFAAGDITGVVVALGGKTSDVGETMLTDGTANVISAMKAGGVSRISVVSTIGAGDSMDQAPFAFKMLMWTVMKKIIADKNNQEALFLDGPGADLEWTIVRPGGLNVEAPTGVINVIKGQAGSIARADVADFCLGAVIEAEFPYLRTTPCISSVGGTAWTKDRSAKSRGMD